VDAGACQACTLRCGWSERGQRSTLDIVHGEEFDPPVLFAGGVPGVGAVRVEPGHRPPDRPPQLGGVLPGGVG